MSQIKMNKSILLYLLAAYSITITLYSYSYFTDLSCQNLSKDQNIIIQDKNSSLRKSFKKPKIFCMILTTKNNLKNKAKVIFDLWASQCDGYRFISMMPDSANKFTATDTFKELKYEDLFDVLQPVELKEDIYKKLTHKVYAGFRHVYNNHQDYDWYLKADDDTVVFFDNLRQFLTDKDKNAPITYGYNINLDVPMGYHSGGAGYLLSKESLSRLGKKLNEDFKFCPDNGVEDQDIARCLRMLQVSPGISIDKKGLERFHPMNLTAHFEGDIPKWMFTYSANYPKKGLECCSDSLISFHYVNLKELLVFDKILKGKSYKSVNFTFEQLKIDFYDMNI